MIALLGLLMGITAHICTYIDYFMQMGAVFAITFLIKKLIKSNGDKVKADIIGFAGYTLLIVVFITYLLSVKSDLMGRPMATPNFMNDVSEFLSKYNN